MISYYDLPFYIHSILGVIDIIAITGSIFILIKVCDMHMTKLCIVSAAVFAVYNMLLFQVINDVGANLVGDSKIVFAADIAEQVPFAVVVAFILISMTVDILVLLKLWSVEEEMLTPGAIKDFVDEMHYGICFYDEDGMPLFVNRQMNRLCVAITGRELMNGVTFTGMFMDGGNSGGVDIIRKNPTVMISDVDGTVWEFQMEKFNMRRNSINEIRAYDITEWYNLNIRLGERIDSLNVVNERLRSYGKEVDKVARESEVMTAKIRVHDDVGKCLLAFRAYEKQPENKRDRDNLLLMWRYNMAVMKNEMEEQTSVDQWAQLMKAAEAIRVEIDFKGEIPDSNPERQILISAIHECMTNAVKYADGNRLSVISEMYYDYTEIGIMNNGNPPSREIEEKGGLTNLRIMVENTGGKMFIRSFPEFKLHIEVPGGKGFNGKSKSYDC